MADARRPTLPDVPPPFRSAADPGGGPLQTESGPSAGKIAVTESPAVGAAGGHCPGRRVLTALYVFNFPEVIGGGEESLRSLIGTLPRDAIRPVLVVPAPGEIARWAQSVGLPVHVVPMPTLKPLPGWKNVRPVRSLAGILSQDRVDLVHANGSRAMLYAGLAALRYRTPIVWHVRIADPDPWLDGVLSRLATAIIANSRATAARFGGRVADGVHVIYNGVDLARFHPGSPDSGLRRALGLPPDGPVVTYVGRLEHGKGPDVFLQAAIHVHRECPAATFLWVGDGPMRSTLDSQVKVEGLPAAFAGRRPDLLPILHLSSALVVPSRQEGFGRVLIEAMAAQVPVVATRVGGIPEVCVDGRTGLLVPPEDPAALASAILTTLTQIEATRARVRAAAGDVRARFSLTEHTKRIIALYTQLLAGRPRHGTKSG
jgi:glycosyltransferase involved in cell wall biosynthesis